MGSEQRREEKKKSLMTLFSSITQVENDCNAKSTNGFNGIFFSRVSVKQLRESKMHQIERATLLTPPIFQQQYQLVAISPAFSARLFNSKNPCCEMIVDGK